MTAQPGPGAMRGPLRGGACGDAHAARAHARAIAGIVGAGAGPTA